MSEKIKVEELGLAIAENMKSYIGATDLIVEEVVKKVGIETAKVVRGAGTYKDRSGDYRKSIKFEKLKGKKHIATGVVHADGEEYRLTHLLEFGHAKVNGGRVRPYSHFSSGETFAKIQLIKELEEKLGG